MPRDDEGGSSIGGGSSSDGGGGEKEKKKIFIFFLIYIFIFFFLCNRILITLTDMLCYGDIQQPLCRNDRTSVALARNSEIQY